MCIVNYAVQCIHDVILNLINISDFYKHRLPTNKFENVLLFLFLTDYTLNTNDFINPIFLAVNDFILFPITHMNILQTLLCPCVYVYSMSLFRFDNRYRGYGSILGGKQARQNVGVSTDRGILFHSVTGTLTPTRETLKRRGFRTVQIRVYACKHLKQSPPIALQ